MSSITIVNVMPQFGASISGVVIYNRKMFIIQATDMYTQRQKIITILKTQKISFLSAVYQSNGICHNIEQWDFHRFLRK